LVPSWGRNVERTTVFIFEHDVDGVTRVRLLPVDLKKSSDRERSGLRAYLVPATSKKKKETLANLSAISEENLSPHAWVRRYFRC